MKFYVILTCVECQIFDFALFQALKSTNHRHRHAEIGSNTPEGAAVS